MESQVADTTAVSMLSREGSMTTNRGMALENDDQQPAATSSAPSSSTAPSIAAEIDMNLYSNEIKLLQEAAQKDESGNQFRAIINSVSRKREDLHVPDLVTRICFSKSGDTLLHMAARSGKKEVVKLILDLVPSLLMTKNAAEETVWHVTASTGHLGVFLCLLFYREDQDQTGNDLMDQDSKGNTAMHVALINYQEEIAMILCKINPKLCNVLNNENRPATYLAAYAGHISFLKSMPLSDSESTAEEIESAAIAGKQLDVLEYVKSKFETSFSTASEQISYIHLAVTCGFIEGIEFFIRLYGKETLATLKEDTLNKNMLHMAAESKDFGLVLFFLGKKVFKEMINDNDNDGNTPLHLAARNCHFMATYYLAWHPQVDLTKVNKAGLNALEAAELFTKNFFSLSKWLTLSSLRAAGMRSSSPENTEYPTKEPPVSDTFDSLKSAKKQLISILVVALITVAVSAFIGILATSFIGSTYNVKKSRRLRLAAVLDIGILLISVLITFSIIWWHDYKKLGDIISDFVVPFLKLSATTVMVQLAVILYMALRYLNSWVKSAIPAIILGLIGFLFSPFLPTKMLPVLPWQRRVTSYPVWLLLSLCHYFRN